VCIIIDINCLSSVFNNDDPDYKDFKPVNDWIYKGKGKIVMGGSKYNEELSQARKYLRLITELSRRNKVVHCDDTVVDNHQAIIEGLIDDNGCDDPHLIAIVRATHVRLVCTKEERAIKYLKNIQLYEHSTHRPKIYRRAEHHNLLIDNNLANCCK